MKKKLFKALLIVLPFTLSACSLSMFDFDFGSNGTSENSESSSGGESSDSSSSGSSSSSSSSSSSDPTIYVSKITLSATHLDLNINAKATLSATVKPNNATLKTIAWSSSNNAICEVDENGLVTANGVGEAAVRATAVDGSGVYGECTVSVSDPASSEVFTKAETKYTYYSLDSTANVQNHGNQKVLVIPTYFTDDTGNVSDANRLFIEKSFFGTNEECGWRSFAGYYEEASYGNLHYSGYVCDRWYAAPAKYTVSYVQNNQSSSQELAVSALSWFIETYPTFDLSPYDANNDGYIDSLYLIYASDYRIVDGKTTNLWGYRWSTSDSVNTPFKAKAFSWFSLKFLKDTTSGQSYGGVPADGSNTRIIIHEHGHMLGLKDYYDYAYSGMDLVGSWDMQSLNVFDWNAFSKYAVGWVNPYFIDQDALEAQGSATITINSSALSGDCIVVKGKDWNGSPFDEYLMLELFNPHAGNNAYDYQYNNYNGIKNTGFGVKIYHVDSRMVDYHYNNGWVCEPTDEINSTGQGTSHLTFIPNSNDSKTYDSFNSYGKALGWTEWEDYHLLQLLQKGNTCTFDKEDESSRHTWIKSDLWQTGDTFCIGVHEGYTNYGPSFFVNGNTFNDGTELPYGIRFDSVSENSATITFTYLG